MFFTVANYANQKKSLQLKFNVLKQNDVFDQKIKTS